MIDKILKLALALAQTRRGFCSPNPSVGAIIVKDNHILAKGCHWQCNSSHAEVTALNQVNNETARGATLYVTLEPCCHTEKKTPPCTDIIIKRGIASVVYGFRDPNPEVSGKSEKILQKAGIETIYHPLPEIDYFYKSYKFWWQHKRPFITAKIALSSDGKIAKIKRKRVKKINITGETARLFTHQQRKIADAILTTAKTIECDNPQLNVRLNEEIIKKPIYVLDSKLSIPTNALIFTTAKSVTIFHRDDLKKMENEKYKQKARLIPVSFDECGLNLIEVIEQISRDGIHDLWVEAGGKCFSSLAKEKLLQRAFIYFSPKCLGEKAKIAFTDDSEIFSAVQHVKWFSLDQDIACEIEW